MLTTKKVESKKGVNMSYLDKHTNRLINEDSPYLVQHAHNPVDWYPWGDEAFANARDEKKPIFLSIGYSACHWCHVMEREVFEDEALAALLNKLFVSIKVDREERPDIDKHFQHIHYIITRRSGGWPTSIFLTPDKKPFFAATYLPPRPKHGLNGFGEIITMLYDKLQNEPHEVYGSASRIEQISKSNQQRMPKPIDFQLLPILKTAVTKSFDIEDGGILGEPKFPHAALLMLLLDSKDKELVDTALHTLRCMAKGGMYDIIDGGFCRYSVDSFWIVPHFEKMAYDNGLLIEAYSMAYGVSSEPFFLEIAKECVDFMIDKMSVDGLFYSASDADSQEEEGKYFVYSYAEALEALQSGGVDNAKDILKILGFSRIGNFEGKNIPRNEEFIKNNDVEKAISILKNIRKERVYPFIDTKVICSWNAMVIAGMFELAKYENNYGDKAIKSLEALTTKLFKNGTLYHCSLADREPKVEAFFEDYSFLAKAYLSAYGFTKQSSYLEMAKYLCDTAIKKFLIGGTWMMSVGEFETDADPSDSSYSSAVGIMCEALSCFGDEYKGIVSDTLLRYADEIKTYPLYYASLASNIE